MLAEEREREAVKRRLRQLVEFWRITEEELEQARPPDAVCKAVKYRHPVSGEEWDGEGEHPQWLREALLREGYTVSALKVEP